ncbi:hypothetical protein ACH5RR_011443 [Cinchona calisaya]|uniref:Uncharacterized protein n=1 Tax=Cinchona calisaya TaxID=153742 RepID=A0ABD3A8I2_9GENT
MSMHGKTDSELTSHAPSSPNKAVYYVPMKGRRLPIHSTLRPFSAQWAGRTATLVTRLPLGTPVPSNRAHRSQVVGPGDTMIIVKGQRRRNGKSLMAS